MTNQTSRFSFPDAIRDSVTLSNGRVLSYYAFDTTTTTVEGNKTNSSRHPVLHLHGFPGCGLEGALCANQVAKAGGQLFAIDRPGFGHSDPYNSDSKNKDLSNAADARLDAFCDIIWDFVRKMKWESFSIIGVSGGGPYSLALLDSYLKRKDSSPKLAAVSVVAGIYCPAGTSDMMPANQRLSQLVETDTMRSNFQLWLQFSALSVLLKLPESVVSKQLSFETLPQVDQVILHDPTVSKYMVKIIRSAMRQGSSATILEAKTLFRSSPVYDFRQYDMGRLPKVSLFQGMTDVNVPPSHCQSVYNSFPDGHCNMTTYESLGHVSMVGTKADDYAQSVMP